MKDLADYLHHLDKNKTAHNDCFKCRLTCFFPFLMSSGTPKGVEDLPDFWEKRAKFDEKDPMTLDMLTLAK